MANSTTYATLSEGRLNIGGKETTTQELGINSDISNAHRAVAALPDLAKITEKQQIVAKATSDIVSATHTFSSNRQKTAAENKAKAEAEFEGRLKAQNDGSYEAYAKLDETERQNILINYSETYRKGVQADTRNLHIESVQDTETYQSKQQNGNVQVTVGYGLSAGGSYSRSKIRADHASVTGQSGIYAGEDGYQIKVGDNTDLKGGIITSARTAESKGKNLFQTATLTAGDIQNHSRYEGKSFGIGGRLDLNGGWDGTVTDKQGRPADRISSAAGYGSDGDSKNSTTRSGINTRNIHITDEAGQLARTGRTAKETEARIRTGIDTETADQHSGRLKNSFDKDGVVKEINLQREVTQEFGGTLQGLNTEIERSLDGLKEKLAKGEIDRKEYEDGLKVRQRGKVLLNMIGAGLSAPTDSAAGIAAATASPALSYQIGQ